MLDAKRVVFLGPEQADLEAFAFDPNLPSNQVLFRTEWSLISPGTELAIYTDQHDIGHRPQESFPTYPGYAAVGVIEKTGREVKNLQTGDHVFAITGHASHACFNPERTFCLRLPEDLPGDLAVFIRMALIPLATLCRAEIQAGEWLGVVGLGLVGNLGAQFGRQAGYKVLGVGRSAMRSDIAQACKISPVLTGSRDEIAIQTQEMTGGRGCRLVLDTSGTTGGLLQALGMAGAGATISLVGVPWLTDSAVAATEIMQPVFSNYLKLQGGWEWDLPLYEKEAGKSVPMLPNRYSIERNARYALALIQNGELLVEPLITHRIRPEDIQSAYQGLLSKRNEYLGVLIDWRDGTQSAPSF